jgi:hypothetical protein
MLALARTRDYQEILEIFCRYWSGRGRFTPAREVGENRYRQPRSVVVSLNSP